MAKRKYASKNNSVRSTTWILFAIFLVVSVFCFKVIMTAQEISNSIKVEQPVQVVVVTKTPTKSPSKLK